MRCQEFSEISDSYLGDELLVETNHEVLRHLENCPACRIELAARRGLLTQMRIAFKDTPEMRLNQAFAVKLSNDLRRTALRPGVWENLKSGSFSGTRLFAATAAACFLLMTMFGIVWFNRGLSFTEDIAENGQNQTKNAIEISRSNESPLLTVQTIQAAWLELTHAAIGDHENCALRYRLPEKPIALAEAEKYGRFNKDLDKTVMASLREVSAEKNPEKITGKIEFIDAHSCVYNGRRFTHIELQSGEKTVSVLVTNADLTDESNGTMTNQTTENFQIAGFRASRHAVFVISDLSERENSAIAETLAPAVRRHIERAEA